MGDPEAVTTEGENYQTPGILRWVWRSIVGEEPKAPEPFRSRLLRHCFINLDVPRGPPPDPSASADDIESRIGAVDTVLKEIEAAQVPQLLVWAKSDVADRDDVISVETANGKRRSHAPHKIKGAAFALLNERNEVVIGGRK